MMRKFVLIFVVIACLFTCSCRDSENNTSQQEQSSPSSQLPSDPSSASFDSIGDIYIDQLSLEYPLDLEYKDAFEKSMKSNVEFCEITREYANKWKEKMNTYYTCMMNELDDDGKKLLEKSQKEWERFYETNDLLNERTTETFGAGTIVPIIQAKHELVKYRSRAIDLLLKCHNLGLQVE